MIKTRLCDRCGEDTVSGRCTSCRLRANQYRTYIPVRDGDDAAGREILARQRERRERDRKNAVAMMTFYVVVSGVVGWLVASAIHRSPWEVSIFAIAFIGAMRFLIDLETERMFPR